MFQDEPDWQRSDELDRITAFSEFMRNLDGRAEEVKLRERQRIERKRREQFTQMVKELLASREIRSTSTSFS